MGTLSEVEEDFIGETLEILTELCRNCGDLEDTAAGNAGRRNIQRGLHTIKGNSPAFGFEEFGEVAGALLERVKRVSESGGKEESRNLAPLILEFVTRSRQYLGLVREGRSRPFFGGIFRSLRDQLEGESSSGRDRSADCVEPHDRTRRVVKADPPERSRAGGRQTDRPEHPEPTRPKKASSLKEKLEAILATAPPVKPNLEQLSKLAARRLKLKPARAVADIRPAPVPMDAERPENSRGTPGERGASTCPAPSAERPTAASSADPADPAAPTDPAHAALLSEVPSSASSSAGPPAPAAPSVREASSAGGTAVPEVPVRPSPADERAALRSTPAVPEVATRAPETTPEDDDDPASGSEVTGLLTEALRAREAAAIVRAEVDQAAHLRGHMEQVLKFLDGFCQWARDRQSTPLQNALDRSVEDLEALATRLGLEVTVSAARTSRLAPPLLAELARQAIGELLRGLSLLWKRDGERRSLGLSVSETPGRVEIRIAGAGSPSALAARLRVYAIKRSLEEIGGDLLTEAPGDDLVVILPDNLQSIEVCLLRSGASRVGLPGHRVIDIRSISRDDVMCVGAECRCRLEDEEISVVDLTGSPMGASGDDSPERCLVVLRGGSGRHGLVVDECLGRTEMLVLVETGVTQGGDIVGSCFRTLEGGTVPLLDFKAPRELVEGPTP